MSTITKEWLQQKIADMEVVREDIPFGLDEDDSNTLAALRIALASLEAEPVAWRYRTTDINGNPNPHWSFSEEESLLWLYQPLFSAPPAPVSVPDDVMTAIQKVARIRLDLNDFDGDRRGIAESLGKAEEALIEVVNRRAAMLQGAEPVTTANKLPFEQWLSQQTGTIDVECGCVMTEVFFHWLRVAYEAGNSPVIADGWVACSERMPERDYVLAADFSGKQYPANLPNIQIGIYADWFDDGCSCWDDGDGNDLHLKQVTHWAQIPAAPQREAE